MSDYDDGPSWEQDLKLANVAQVSLAKQAEVEAVETYSRMCQLFANSGWTCPTVNGMARGWAAPDLQIVREYRTDGPLCFTYAGAFQEAIRPTATELEHRNAPWAWNDAAYEGDPDPMLPPYASAGFVWLRALAREVCKLAGIEPGDTGRKLFETHRQGSVVVRLAPPDPFML